MCGIAGVLAPGGQATAADEALARAMITALAHRGPDGLRVERGAGWAMAHARLSIIDLEGGWQPLHADGWTVVGNGELYNYVELAAAFGLQPRLRTGSDFEPLLHLTHDQGADAALDRLRGMYALALVEGAGAGAWLDRDAFGIKPLYLARAGAGRLAFASEPRALAAAGLVAPRVRPDKAQELLALNYTLGRDSIFDGVRRLAPGERLRAGDAPEAQDRGARDIGGPGPAADDGARAAGGFLARAHAPVAIDEAAALARLDAVLEDSVRVHQRADVPYGLFLSGGIDSTAIATVMARLDSRPVTAFTCGFDNPGAADERRAAERVARALDLDWRETRFTAEDFWRIAPQVAWALDDPTTDFAALPTWRLAEAAKGALTVVLTGEGGDELFGGYGRYRRALRSRWLGGRAAEPQVHAPWLADGGSAALARWRAATQADASRGLTPLQRMQAADIAAWLPHDLLLKLDRCLMAHGLEGRTPFLDPVVAEFAFHLPDRLKLRGRHGKWLLRRWLERACPAAGAWAPKQGFTVPVERWIAPRARELGPRIAACEGVRALCEPERVAEAFAGTEGRDGARRWPLVFYALWWTIHVGGASTAEAAAAIIGDG